MIGPSGRSARYGADELERMRASAAAMARAASAVITFPDSDSTSTCNDRLVALKRSCASIKAVYSGASGAKLSMVGAISSCGMNAPRAAVIARPSTTTTTGARRMIAERKRMRPVNLELSGALVRLNEALSSDTDLVIFVSWFPNRCQREIESFRPRSSCSSTKGSGVSRWTMWHGGLEYRE